GKDRRDGAGDVAFKRHFDKDKRFVDQRRVEEGVAATVWRIDAPPQIIPTPDFVYSLVPDNLFEHDCWRRPVDMAQHQKTTIEPRRKQVDKVSVDRSKIVATMVQRIHQLLAHAHQSSSTARREIEPAK